jgi:H+/Cl- antiporter ClcA
VDPRAVGYLKSLVYAAILGIPVSFAAVLFQTVVHDSTHFVWEWVPHELDWSSPPGWYVVAITGLAGVLVALFVRLPGHGGHSPLEGLSAGPVLPVTLPGILLAALATLSLGIVLGPEAPLIALGIGLGTLAVRFVRVEDDIQKLLVLAGAFAAIGALFGGPVVAAFLLLEVTAASGQIEPRQIGRALLPGFVAAGTGALVMTGVGDWPGLHQQNLALPNLPAYDSVRVKDIVWCIVVSIVIAIVVVASRHLAHRVKRACEIRPDVGLVAAGLLVGVLAVFFRAVADRPVEYVLFSGQTELPEIVAEGSAGVLIALVVFKGLAYTLSLGAGFKGGPVFPAISIGVALALVGADALPGLATTPAVAAGVAAATSAVLKTPFTAVVLASILVGSSAADVAPIAVFAAAVGWLAAVALPNPEDRAVEAEAERTEAAEQASDR